MVRAFIECGEGKNYRGVDGVEQKRVFSNGEVVIKTGDGIFFHAHSESAMPILIDKEDGEKLFNLKDEEEHQDR